MQKVLVLLVLLCLPTQAWAQASIVAMAKQQLQAQGTDLSGACGGLRITNATAWLLREHGAGTYYKPNGTQCEQRSIDTLVFTDGRTFDILQDGENAQIPQWNQNIGPNPTDAALWRAPTNPFGPTPQPTPTPTPVPVPTLDLSGVYQRLEAQYAQIERIYTDLLNRDERQISQLQTIQRQNETLSEQLRKHDEEPMWVMKFLGNRFTQLFLAGGGAVAIKEWIEK